MNETEQGHRAAGGRVPLPLVVGLRPELAGHGEALRQPLLHLVDGLIDDLGIPAEPELTVGGAADLPEPFVVGIGDRTCVPPAGADGTDADAPELLAEAIAGTVAVNREALLIPPVADRLARDWSASSALVAGSGLPGDAVASVLTDLVRRCVSVTPSRAADGGGGDDGPLDGTADALGEVLLDARGIGSISLFVRPELLEPPANGGPATLDYDLSTMGETLQELFVDELGLLLPAVRFVGDPGLPPGRLSLQVNDLRFPPLRGLLLEEVFVAASVDDVARHGMAARRTSNPALGGEAAVVADPASAEALVAAGYATAGPRAYATFVTRRELRRVAGSLLLPDALMLQLNRLRDQGRITVGTALERFGVPLVTAVFRCLLDEQVPVHNAIGILEGMLAGGRAVSVDESLYDVVAPAAEPLWPRADGSGPSAPLASRYAEGVRRHLRAHMTRWVAADDGRIHALHVDGRLESRLRGDTAPLDGDEWTRLRHAVGAALEPLAGSGTTPVAITSSEARLRLRRLFAPVFPDLRILSRSELEPGADIHWRGGIDWA